LETVNLGFSGNLLTNYCFIIFFLTEPNSRARCVCGHIDLIIMNLYDGVDSKKYADEKIFTISRGTKSNPGRVAASAATRAEASF